MNTGNVIARSAWAGLALFAGLVWTAETALSQDGTAQLVSVDLPLALTVEEATIDGCVAIDMVDLLSAWPVYRCLPIGVHAVRDSRGQIVGYGYQRLRDEIRVLEQPMAGPIRVMEFQSEEAAARKAGLALGENLPQNVRAALLDPNVAKDLAGKQIGQPELNVAEDRAYQVLLPQSFGEVAPLGSALGAFAPDPDAAGVRVATLNVARDQMDSPFRFVLRDNPACTYEFVASANPDVEELALDRLIACQPMQIDMTARLDIPPPEGCRRVETGLSCVLQNTVRTVTIQAPGFEPVDLPVAPQQNLDIGAMRPVLALQPRYPALAGNGVQGACARPGWDVVLTAYFSSIDNCSLDFVPRGLAPRAGGDRFQMPTLGEAAWSGDGLPTLARVTLQSRGASDPYSFPIPLGGDLPPEIRSALSAEPRLPLDVDFSDPNITLGATGTRMLRVYYDQNCAKPVERGEKSLRHASTRNPDVPACGGFFQVFDDDQPRSACAPLEVAADRLIARPIIAACDAKRLLVLVIENQKDNGGTGSAIYRALDDLARQMFAQKNDRCFPVDVWRARDLDHEELFRGEDLRLAADVDTFLNELPTPEFSNDNSDPVGDFRWVDEDWVGDLGGVLIVGRGTPNQEVTAADRGVALTWALDQVYTHALLSGGPEACGIYEKQFRFANCGQIGPNFNAGQLMTAIETALKEMGN